MNKNKNAVVYLGMSLYGAVRDGAQFAVGMNKIAMNDASFDLFFAATVHEHTSGAWEIVNKSFLKDRRITGQNLNEVISNVVALLSDYENIVFDFGGGLRQMLSILPYKRIYKNRLKLVVTTHSFANGTLLQPLFSLLQGVLYLKYVDKVVFQCPYVARIFKLSNLLFNRGKACIIPLPIIKEEQIEHLEDTSIRNNGLLNILQNKNLFKIVYLAEFRKLKQHLWLTKALLPLVKNYPQLHILYCGSKDKKIMPQIEHMIEREGVINQFHITGKVSKDKIPFVLDLCDCAIVASKSETFGFTYIEPMMAGIPVIGTRVGVGEYIIQDYGTGFGLNLKSKSSLRRNVEFLMNNRDTCVRMGLAGQSIVKEMFSIENIAKCRIGMYNEIFS